MTALSLTVNGLNSGYGQTRIIEDMSFEVASGSRLAILGRNGVGKTTLFASLAGFTRHYSGTIKLGNRDISKFSPSERALAGLGLVPQTRDIFPTLTVEENLITGLKQRPKTAIEEAYALFPRLKERRNNMGGQLSGGEQQMLSTARTILGKPKLLLLDEPLEGLAPVICDELMTAFKKMAQSNDMSILLVEQRIEPALEFADHLLILERGQIAFKGTPQDLKQDPTIIETLLGVGGLH
ncbi:ABC transporter ATP-binding protein [Bartonella sp. HY038]|uniref:ABC transporter ATP-binding protein n=1 Tax=Bartonella sp. HY038 TaxID=2759660 RepID=UPI0015FA90B8|nr:ABC transporter ATP-binding protein [Bartonella sp. HY038]